ncbi:PREDICTED: uncharacterized protein LOC107071170 isoform X1 [Polistes dominula]|uniref:Uncharacterized protein LOC107071170 isoform X1 n=1 Tax=Polistes dominula TaxID=743375 RepID=A0ABM1IYX0_POLDO|nr:PREDICTED: uncharacterized protein LOC107071170 isoform X1 [Polistes dominula]
MVVAIKNVRLFDGRIKALNSNGTAEIVFSYNGKLQIAALDKHTFFYNAREIPKQERLSKYVSVNTEVFFIGNYIKTDAIREQWLTLMCWPKEHSLGDKIVIKGGMVNIPGRIINLDDKEGFLNPIECDDQPLKVFFTLNESYFHGTKLSTQPELLAKLNTNTILYFDALPCLPKENKYNCEWRATCVYVGKRPSLDNAVVESSNEATKQILLDIQKCFIFPLSMFIVGKGQFVVSIDDNFGLILAQFQDNVYKEILFHKKNAYVFNMCLENEKLSNIFKKGDKLHFIAVEAKKFVGLIKWFAIQVSVCDYGE